MIERTILVGDKPVRFRASAAVPRLYRFTFRRDLFQDFAKLQAAYDDHQEGEPFAVPDLELFENVAYIMARHADADVPERVEDWLEQFDLFSILLILPQLLELWALNQETLVDAKKNSVPPTGR